MSNSIDELHDDEEEQEHDSSSLIPLEYDDSSSEPSQRSSPSTWTWCCSGRPNNSRRGSGGSIRPAAVLFGLAFFLAGLSMTCYGAYILVTLTEEIQNAGDDPHIKSRGIGLLVLGLLLLPPGGTHHTISIIMILFFLSLCIMSEEVRTCCFSQDIDIIISYSAYELWRFFDGWIGCRCCCGRSRRSVPASPSWTRSVQ
jgi:hypothetical protein